MNFLHFFLVSLFFLRLGAADKHRDEYCEALKHILLKGKTTENFPRGTRVQIDPLGTGVYVPESHEESMSTKPARQETIEVSFGETDMHFLVDRKIEKAAGLLAKLSGADILPVNVKGEMKRRWMSFKDRCGDLFEGTTLVWRVFGWRTLKKSKVGAENENCKAVERILLKGKMKTSHGKDMDLPLDLSKMKVITPLTTNTGPFAIEFGPGHIEYYEVTKKIEEAVRQLRSLPLSQTEVTNIAEGGARRSWKKFQETCAYLNGKSVRKRSFLGFKWRYLAKAKKSEPRMEDIEDLI